MCYTDDFMILCKRNPEFYLEQARAVLDRLGLTLNAEKTRIVHAREGSFDFLGGWFVVQRSSRTGNWNPYSYPTPKATASVKRRIREIARTGQHRNLPDFIDHWLNPVLRGWGHYFKTGNSQKHLKSIDNYAV